ncbi:hypothetical protein LTR86_009384 [Recurvomyces mirabilis]|nr:hypothetical protein LTR86_009384 [Recurvomyces mirabilis]
MCVAGLNVSTQPCNHRWVELQQQCEPTKNLANCPEKLRIAGWETRNEHCPWCNDNETSTSSSTHRLFGSSQAGSSPSSPMASDFLATRHGRSGSLSTLSSLSRHSSSASTGSDRGQRHREMNERLHLYLTLHPHETLPSARKNYPTYVSSPVDETSTSDGYGSRSSSSALSKGLMKSVRFSKNMFKG